MSEIKQGRIVGTEFEVKYVSWDTYAALEQNILSMEETNRVLVARCQELVEALSDIVSSARLLPNAQDLKGEIDFAQQALNKAKGL